MFNNSDTQLLDELKTFTQANDCSLTDAFNEWRQEMMLLKTQLEDRNITIQQMEENNGTLGKASVNQIQEIKVLHDKVELRDRTIKQMKEQVEIFLKQGGNDMKKMKCDSIYRNTKVPVFYIS